MSESLQGCYSSSDSPLSPSRPLSISLSVHFLPLPSPFVSSGPRLGGLYVPPSTNKRVFLLAPATAFRGCLHACSWSPVVKVQKFSLPAARYGFLKKPLRLRFSLCNVSR